MNMQDKHSDTTEPNIVPKKEQRGCLSCNNIGNRCSSLGCVKDIELTPERIKEFVEFAKILKQIHVRLMMEGHNIDDLRDRIRKQVVRHEYNDKTITE